MVTTEALKLLYQKLGGTADVENVTAISEMVDLIEDVAGTSSGGTSGMLVTMTYDETGDATLDKTFAEIKASVEAGIVPVIEEGYENSDGEESWLIYHLCKLTGGTDGGECQAIFYYYWPSDDAFYAMTFSASTTTSALTYTASSSGGDNQ